MENKLKYYLGTELKIKCPNGFIANGKESTGVSGIAYLTADLYADIVNDTFNGAVFKPILRPLSDLKNDDKTLDDIDLLLEPNGFEINRDYYFLLRNNLKNISISFEEMQSFLNLLYLEHYDIFELIEKGLAIDINTLNNGK